VACGCDVGEGELEEVADLGGKMMSGWESPNRPARRRPRRLHAGGSGGALAALDRKTATAKQGLDRRGVQLAGVAEIGGKRRRSVHGDIWPASTPKR
jgi:hypothetical protein